MALLRRRLLNSGCVVVCKRRPTTPHETPGATVGNRQLPRPQFQRRLVRTQPGKKEGRTWKGGSGQGHQRSVPSKEGHIRISLTATTTLWRIVTNQVGKARRTKAKEQAGDSSGSAYTGGSRSMFDEHMSREIELHIRNKTFPGCDKANTPYVDCLCPA